MLGVMLPKDTGCCPKAWGMPGTYCACKGDYWFYPHPGFIAMHPSSSHFWDDV